MSLILGFLIGDVKCPLDRSHRIVRTALLTPKRSCRNAEVSVPEPGIKGSSPTSEYVDIQSLAAGVALTVAP